MSIGNILKNLKTDCITPVFDIGYGVISGLVLAKGVAMTSGALTTAARIGGISTLAIGLSAIVFTLIFLADYGLKTHQEIQARVQRVGYAKITCDNIKRFITLIIILPVMPVVFFVTVTSYTVEIIRALA